MGSVFNRGTRHRPSWYIKFRDLDGEWKMRPSKKPTKAQAEQYLKQVESRVADGKIGVLAPTAQSLCGALLTTWLASLRNRNAQDDRTRAARHLRPTFDKMTAQQAQELATVLTWIDAQRAAGALKDASIRMNLNLLSRFFNWGVERGHFKLNPVRLIPTGRRPQQSQKTDVPWVGDEDTVLAAFERLRTPINLMFYLCNRSGLRTGEVTGLRLADLGFLAEGLIRVRFTYNGEPLKEDKRGTGKVKFVPAPEDAVEVLGPWLKRREEAGAQPEDLVFPTKGKRAFNRNNIKREWDKAAKAAGIEGMTWYQATRHSFTSRNLAAGASLDEVSAALGHSSPTVTRRYYDHFVRRVFSPTLRAGLPKPNLPDNVVPLPARKPAAE